MRMDALDRQSCFSLGLCIVVEGKVGWLVFSAIYLSVGVIYGFFLQMGTLIVGMDEGVALGASQPSLAC